MIFQSESHVKRFLNGYIGQILITAIYQTAFLIPVVFGGLYLLITLS